MDHLRELINNVIALVNEISLENKFDETSFCYEDIRAIKTSAETMLKIIEEIVIAKEIPKSQLLLVRHNLRNPINAIKGYSEICMEDLFKNNKKASQKFLIIRNTANTMLELINSLKETEQENLINKPQVEFSFTYGIEKARILIVDDIESNRTLLDKWLKRKDFLTTLAKNGREAITLLESSSFDIVLLDIMMPEIDGFQVLKYMKTNERLADLIVIVISAVDEMDSIVRCIKLGAMDYLIKPFDSFLLEARVSACLQNKYLRTLYQERLITIEKLSSLKNITAGIAHELKNPLNFVNSFSKLSLNIVTSLENALGRIENKIPQQEMNYFKNNILTLKHNIEIIDQQSKRADGVIERMNELAAASSKQDFIKINLTKFIDLAFEVIYEGYRREIAINFIHTFEPESETIEVIQEKFFFVLINLFNNAFYALIKKQNLLKDFIPKITVITQKVGNTIEIKITDNGLGIADSDKVKIFTPFFTTKPPGEGIGLGLSISHNIITQLHKGKITFDSEENEFTTFTITLPL